jgi:hypothetical protein
MAAYAAAMQAAQEEERLRQQAEEEAATGPRWQGPPQARLALLAPDGTLANRTVGVAPFPIHLLVAGNLSTPHAYWTLRDERSRILLADGLEFPSTFRTTLLAPGEHVFRLYLSDGRLADVDRVTVVVEAPPPPPDVVIEDHITGLWVPYAGYAPAIHTHDFRLDVPVARITVNITSDEAAFDLDMELIAPDGTIAGTRAGFNEPTGNLLVPEEAPIVVTDPALTYQMGEWILRVKPAAAVDGSYRVVVSFET